VFTNLTRDHLDFHVTMEAYFAASKSCSPARRRAAGFRRADRDDSYSRALHVAPETRVFWYGIGPDSDCARCTSSPEASGCASTSSMASSVSRWNRR